MRLYSPLRNTISFSRGIVIDMCTPLVCESGDNEFMTSALPFFSDLEKLRHRWGWFLVLGILLVILGMVAFIVVPVATLATVLILGWVLVISGVIEFIH